MCCASYCRLALAAADVDVTGPYSPPAPPGHLGAEATGLGHELQARLPELADPPAVDDGVEDGLQVAEPQRAHAHRVEGGAEVEPAAEHGQQAHHRVRQPAHGEANEEDEDGGEGPRLEAHVDAERRRALQAHQAQLAGVADAQASLAGVVVDARGVAAHRVEDAQVRVKHDAERHEEHGYRQQHRVAAVSQRLAVAEDALGRARRLRFAGTPAHYRGQRDTERQHPGGGDEHLGPVWGQLVLPLHDDQEAVYADDQQDGHALEHEQPVEHDRGAAEANAEVPVGGGHGDGSERHAKQREHNVREGQRGQQQVDGRHYT